jgi:hypothetical protein
MVGSFFVILLI